MGIEENFPLEQLTPIAKAEASSRQNYRPIYSLHKWWAQRLGSVFRTIGLSTFLNTDDPNEVWDHYFKSNDFSDKIVLDPFMGSGTTLVELNRLGAKTIGIDINPVAWWTVKKELEPVDTNELEKAFKTLERNVADKIKQYYKTECPICHREADVMYYFWVRKVKCISCGKDVHLFKYHVIAREKEKHPAVVVCPDCWHIFEMHSSREITQCPKCSSEFDPNKGTFEGGDYTCPHCKQGYNVLKTIQRGDSPPECDMYAIEYYCPVCKRRGYKEPSADDLKLYEDVGREFEECKTALIFPEQSVPIGEKTKELLNFNFKTFSSLFNERQILCLSNLLSEIRKIDNKKIRELLITSFSSSLEYHNMLCQYNYTKRHIINSFNHHAFPITMIPCENNIFGINYKVRGRNLGAGTFYSYFTRLFEAKQYCDTPFEKYRSKGKVIKSKVNDEKINGEFAESFEELRNGAKNSMVLCRTSENMDFIPDKSIDAVITDPPYYSNVMYSELADFFYVWLREALKDEYEEFKPELSPKVNEIVKNKVQGKDDDFFIEGITRVFGECCRVLKDDAPMVFTYHHKQSQAWAAVLEAILKAGFYVSAIYPVTSDPSFNPHIRDKNSIEYDAIIICRKRTEEKRTTFENYEEELYINAKKIIENERKKRPHLSRGDISVIVFGKCLEIYSEYYPNITSNGELVSVDTAIDKVWEIIEQLSETDYLPHELDPITRAFTLNLFEPGGISYNELNKRLRQRGIDISELDAEQLISGPKNAKRPADPFSRKKYIEGKLGKDGDILDIDKVQYLYILYTTDKNPSEWLRKWKTLELEQLCKILAEKTGDSRYANVMEITLDMF
ncbi:MAG: hypothetical protein C4B59_09345 [Candidatus Methanogaster sp.]|uniref:Uncharacterized protein n=1 Tax=Candidatus Methanogaster sp. TaxID=3386292 RepID=A0AC61L278_9EURY|nr:MAG: hypothetical protein C4B59_09345 [ANME-2 cluster archaeon]